MSRVLLTQSMAWKEPCFILSDRWHFHMINNLMIAVYAFARYLLTLLSVDEILLPKYVNLFTNLRGQTFWGGGGFFWFQKMFILRPRGCQCFLLLSLGSAAGMRQTKSIRNFFWRPGGGSLEKVVCVGNSKTKNSLLIINNYLLKQ